MCSVACDHFLEKKWKNTGNTQIINFLEFLFFLLLLSWATRHQQGRQTKREEGWKRGKYYVFVLMDFGAE